MPSLDVEVLLRDARLVLDYATNAGLLDDDTLPRSVEGVEQALEAGEKPDVSQLRAALNSSVKIISPFISLIDLRAGRSPFERRHEAWTKAIQVVLSVFSILLAVLIAKATLELNEEESLIKTIQAIQEAKPLEKRGTLRKMLREGALDNPGSPNYYEYQRTARELTDLFAKWQWAVGRAAEMNEKSPWPFVDLFKRMPAVRAETETTAPFYDPCAPKELPAGAPAWQKALSEGLEEYCFARGLNLWLATNAQTVPKMQSHMYLTSAWILPCYAGLFGAAVFLMRFFLTNSRAPVIEWHNVFLRIALGGIAGVIIGWFSASPSGQTPDISTISSVPFGLAFLAGFSIEILFSLLDRLNKLLTSPPAAREGPAK